MVHKYISAFKYCTGVGKPLHSGSISYGFRQLSDA